MCGKSPVSRAMLAGLLAIAGLVARTEARAERLPNNAWQVLAVGYPDDREVAVVLGGAEKTLSAKGICKVKWRDNTATLALEIKNLAAASELGGSGAQYVLWAVDSDKRVVNLGLVPASGKNAKWKVQVPFRTFGLLITAEKSPQATAPSTDVALESRLPANPDLVVPVFRVNLTLTQ